MPRRLPAAFSAPRESAGHLLWLLANRWQRRQRAALEELAVTPVQALLLAGVTWLTREGTPVTQVQLARHTGTDAMTVSQVLRSLQEKRFVKRAPKPGDPRAMAVMPTARGRKLARQAAYLSDQAEKAFVEPLGDPARLRGLLRTLAGEPEAGAAGG